MRNNQSGFTLLEVLVVSLIGLGILLGFTQLYLSGQGTYLQSTTQLQMQRDATLIGDQLGIDAQKATSAVPAAGASGSLELRDAGGATIARYFQSGSANTFYRDTLSSGAGSELALSPIDSLSFTVAGKDVQMGLILKDRFNQKLRVYYNAVMRN